MQVVRARAHGGPEVMRLESVPTPAPGPGQALLRVEAAGVNFIDVYYRRGLYAAELPLPLGLEGAGTVEELGPGPAFVSLGDRVAWAGVPGSYATHVVAPSDRLVPLPRGVETSQAAAVMLQGMTAHYLTHDSYRLGPGDTCLVHAAAGGVGLIICQLARRAGARVIGTVSTDEKATLARAAGAEEIILYTEEDFVAAVARLTSGKGVQVVYDGVGRDTFAGSLDSLALRGYLILFGQASGPVPPVDPQVLNAKGSLFLQRPTLVHHILTREDLLKRAGDVLRWVATGELRVRVGGDFPLEQAANAHRLLESRTTAGKVLLHP